MSRLYLRKASLLVGNDAQQQDLSALHFKWSIRQWDLQTPNRATFRVYNVSDATAQRVQKEFTKLVFQAGYQEGPYGVLFEGTVVQVRRGRENATDSYLDITAADGDEALNFAVVATAVTAGSTFKDRVDLLAKSMGLPQGHVADLPAGALPRGKVMYGMARDHMRDLAFSTDMKWSVQNGALQVIPTEGFLPDTPIVLTSATGMIGLPEQTLDGIKIRSLVNPQIKVGGRVKIDNKSIQQATLDLGVQGSAQNAFIPSVADDGLYRVVVCEHEGDTRGQDWYSDMICIAIGEAVPPGLVAKGYS